MGAAPPCERSHRGLRRSSLRGHETCEGRAEMGAVTREGQREEGRKETQPYAAVNATIVLGGGGRTRAVPLGPSVEVPMGPRNAVLGG
eukprot:7028275-Pyramimonas_sp.AAC.1